MGWHVRDATIRALEQLTQRGDPTTIAAISARLADREWYVVQAAVQALSVVVQRGDADAMWRCIQEHDVASRREAVWALASVAQQNDTALDTFRACLCDGHPEVREAASGALTSVMKFDEKAAVVPRNTCSGLPCLLGGFA